MSDDKPIIIEEPIHEWFELTYAQYLTIPRSVLQSMPVVWQRLFVWCLQELDDMMDWRPKSGRYWVKLKDGEGRYVHDPLMDYQRGRRHIEPRARKSWESPISSVTPRGFQRTEFTDLYGSTCSLQESSLATEEAIWFGVDKDFDGRETNSHRMHLSREAVAVLLPILQHFVETGELKEPTP